MYRIVLRYWDVFVAKGLKLMPFSMATRLSKEVKLQILAKGWWQWERSNCS